MVKYRLPYAFLNGIDKEMLEALQVSLCDNVGSLKDLRVISTLVDAVLKRVLLMTKKNSYAELSEKGVNTKKLFVLTGIDPSYSMSAPRMTMDVVDSYNKKPNGLYLYAKIAYYRNEVHESVDLYEDEVIGYLRYFIAFYVYVIYRFKTDLLNNYPDLQRPMTIHTCDEKNDQILYDFMGYGSGTNALKNRFINSYILNVLSLGPKLKSTLIQEVVDFSRGSLTEKFVMRQVEKLKGKVSYDRVNDTFLLSNIELERLQHVKNDYNERFSDIIGRLEDIIATYKLTLI